LGFLLFGFVTFQFSENAKLGGEGSMSIKKLHADPKSYAHFAALRYNATKGTKLFGLVN